MSLYETKANAIDVEVQGSEPRLFRAEDCRGWIEEEIRHAVNAVLEEILEAEIASHLGAAPSERTEARRGYRNGSDSRQLKTRMGEIELSVPRDREGSFTPGVFEKYRRMESPLEEALLRADLEGVSTRRVGDIAEALSGDGLSATAVSRLNGRLSERLEAWRERRLAKYQEVVELRQRGLGKRAIARKKVGLDRRTVRRWLAHDGFPERKERAARAPAQRKLHPSVCPACDQPASPRPEARLGQQILRGIQCGSRAPWSRKSATMRKVPNLQQRLVKGGSPAPLRRGPPRGGRA